MFKLIVATLVMVFFSGNLFASHPVDAVIEVDRDSFKHIRLNRLKITHDDSGRYILSSQLKRKGGITPAREHIDLVVVRDSVEIYQDSEYYWPQRVRRNSERPSKFKFIIPEEVAQFGSIMNVSFHKKPYTPRPKPSH